ncbi:MAG TPA: sigma-70 family RNA polymerase sigma factor [Myxococcota bacterium]|jgi:RNA polymerase sigma-70 factor (ECF subfamily)|nr:sigma-70 family RNA polymerase sigma factor [Myxococcota bacterium]
MARNWSGEEVTELVRRARTGSSRAFAELVRRYRPRIYALGLHLTGSASDADDIAQEVFLRAYNALDTFEGRGEFFSWLYRIALHLALNQKRNRARRGGPALDDPRVEFAVAVDAHGDPRRAAALRQLYRRLIGALDHLTPVLRSTVVLVALQGMSHAEAADVLDTNAGTIAWRIHEARQRLRAELSGARQPPPIPADARTASAPPPVPPPARQADSGLFNLDSLSRWYH